MDFPVFRCKRPRFDGYEKEPPLYKKKCLASLKTLLDRHPVDSRDRASRLKTGCGHSCICEACTSGWTGHLGDTVSLSEQTSTWADTQKSVEKVLEHLTFKETTDSFILSDSVNKKFLDFHHDITEECGAEDKQHSWAVIEKQEEVIMYGPYYPNYSKGDHSEDVIIKQTQELLESEGVSDDWTVYVFTVNSPCLARSTEPCMLKLVHKAQEWWSVYGVKTHIGYVRCWGFKGNKENVFKDVNYSQVECVNQCVDYESYVKAAGKSTDLNPVCETVFSAVKHLLSSGPLNFPLITSVQKQDRKCYFKNMLAILECKPEDERKILTQEVNTVTEAAEVLLSGKTEGFQGYIETGRTLALEYTFSSQVCDDLRDQMRLVFQQCWREMVQDKYAEFIREKLTEDFNQCTIQLFINDILKLTEDYLQIGRLQFSDEADRKLNTLKS